MRRVLLPAVLAVFVASSASAADSVPADAVAARIKTIREPFEQNVLKSYDAVAAEIKKSIAVDFDVSPQLLLPGEEVALKICARADAQPNPSLEILDGCYDAQPKISTFSIEWKNGADPGSFEAVWKWKPPHCGNYLIHWRCDIGGDIPEFWRNFSVVDRGWAVMILNSTSHIQPRPEPDFHELRLPFSYWAEVSLFNAMPFAENFLAFSRNARQYGDDPGLLIFMAGDYLRDDKTVFYDEPEPVQRAVLECYKRLWPLLGFPKPLNSLYSYGIGNGPANVARSLGINMLGALCADQNWGDGPFKINHWGMPARPYFVSEQDFRKPGAGGANAMLGIQQCERQTILCRDYGCVYSFESAIEYAFEQYAGITRRRTIDDMVLSREMDFLECFIDAATQADHPYIFSSGIEFNGVWPDMAAINRHYMEMLARRARDSKFAITTASSASDFMRAHYDRIPESVAYLPDVFCGMTNGEKPPLYPDTMEIENGTLRAIFRRGDALPYAQYDYETEWKYPDWSNESVPRRPDGYLVSNNDDRFRVTPAIIDTRPFTANVSMEENEKATRVVIDVEARSPQNNLTLAVWNIPRAFTTDSSAFKLSGAKRFIAVRAAYTENLCGIVVADVAEGKNQIELAVSSPVRKPATIDFQIGDSVKAKVFERGGVSIAYLFSDGGAAAEVSCAPQNGADLKHYAFDSDEPHPIASPTTLKIEPGKPQRILGLRCDDVLKTFAGSKPIDSWTTAQTIK